MTTEHSQPEGPANPLDQTSSIRGGVVAVAVAVTPPPQRKVAHYRVIEQIGAGGMGRVYRAEDTTLRREVALKVLSANPGGDGHAADRFLREARALATVQHPNLVAVYQAGVDRGTVYLALELLRGETLEARLRRGALPPAEVVRIGDQIAAGLSAIHARGLIHRDIKPANVWLVAPEAIAPGEGPPRDVKILDFGLARAIDGSTQHTETGVIVGTPAYMSPEQARGLPLDSRTDLFSLGCVLYALATGRAPFTATSSLSQAVAVVTDPHVSARERNPDVPLALSALIDELLEKEPDARPATADDVRARLRGAPAAPGRRSWRGAAALVAGIWLLVAVLVVFLLWQRSSVERLPSEPPPHEAKLSVQVADLEKVREVWYPGPGRPLPPGVDGSVTVGGRRVPRGLFMHPAPPHEHWTHTTFKLPAGYARFVADVAPNDTARDWNWAFVFVVLADGREVWRSEPVRYGDPVRHLDVAIAGARELTLGVVLVEGQHPGAHAAWIDPHVTK